MDITADFGINSAFSYLSSHKTRGKERHEAKYMKEMNILTELFLSHKAIESEHTDMMHKFLNSVCLTLLG